MDSARLQPADHEVIVISDDESESERGLDSSEETSPSQTLSWPDVAEKLLLLAKHRELRADQQAVAALLRDLGVPTSANVNSCLRLACEKLGDLLAFSKGHNRRYRASEDLVLVLCEVLSLVPRQQGGVHVEQIKREPGQPALGAVLRELLQLMEKWRLVIEDCSRTSIGRERALSSTIARLEAMSGECSQRIVHLQNEMDQFETGMETAAEEWTKVMDACRSKLGQLCIGDVERSWRVFDDTFHLTGGVQAQYEQSKSSRNALVRQAREAELRRGFYQAALVMTYTLTQILDSCGQEDPQQQRTILPEERLDFLGNEMLGYMDTFCEGLRTVCGLAGTSNGLAAGTSDDERRLEVLEFIKNFEAFWLVHRNWLPPVVVDMVTKRFATVTTVCGRAGCPVSTTISRVCAGLQSGL